MADKQDVGVKVSQPGYNALDAPDYNLAFSSSWPQIVIAKEYTQTNVAPVDQGGGIWSYPSVTCTHNLGYNAFAFAWVKGYNDGINISTTNVVHRVYDTTLHVNTAVWNEVGIFFSLGTTPPTLTVHIKVYTLDITAPVSYPYKQPPVIARPYDNNYGVKVVKEGKSIDSKDMRDFIIHSRCQSPQVDSVVVGGGSAIYLNTSGYTNWVFGFGGYYDSGSSGPMHYIPAPVDATQAPPSLRVNRDRTGAMVQGSYYCIGGKATSIVVLRDPLFVPGNVEVIY